MANRAVWKLEYDEVSDTFRAFQPVTVPDSRLDSPLASHEAALDVGANNLVACSTTTGNQYIYDGRELFGRFRETTDGSLAYSRSSVRDATVPNGFDGCTDSGRNAVTTHRTRWCATSLNGCTMRVWRRYTWATLTDVLDTHWSVRVNEKTHNFWAFKKFIHHRLACV